MKRQLSKYYTCSAEKKEGIKNNNSEIKFVSVKKTNIKHKSPKERANNNMKWARKKRQTDNKNNNNKKCVQSSLTLFYTSSQRERSLCALFCAFKEHTK